MSGEPERDPVARAADDLDRMAQEMSGEFDTMCRRLLDAIDGRS